MFEFEEEVHVGIFKNCHLKYFSDGSRTRFCGESVRDGFSAGIQSEIDRVVAVLLPSLIVSLLFLLVYLCGEALESAEKHPKVRRYLKVASLILAVAQSILFLITAILSDRSMNNIIAEMEQQRSEADDVTSDCFQASKELSYMVWFMLGFNCIPLLISYGTLAKVVASFFISKDSN